MPKEQQNKIDEEFDNNQILNNLALFEIEEIKDFLHSKLQEAYELGKRDERESIVEKIGELTHYHNDNGVNEIKNGLNYIEVEELNNIIKPLKLIYERQALLLL